MNKIKNFFSRCSGITHNAWLWYKGLYHGRAWYVKTGVACLSLFIAFFLYLGAVDINFLWLFGKSPGYFSGIMHPQTSEASEIYSADGKLIGKYFNENRTPVKYEDVNPAFFHALVDTEDERFYKHFGIDPIGIFGAMKDAVLHHDGRGASTITQQLAKNMFRVRSQYSTGLLGKIPGLKILIIKSKEWIIATKLETVYSKKDIITMYANTVDFGANSYGIKTAAKTYFNTTPRDLTTEQAAVLVGMLKATTYYNPRSNPKNSLSRRNTVLNNMMKHGDLSRTACDSLSQLPIKLDFKVEENYDGQAKYFREAVANYLKDWCEQEGYDLYSSGLKIYTTIDTRMQKYAEEAAIKQMKKVQQNFKAHWGNNDPWIDEKGKVIPGFIEGIAQRQPEYKALMARFPNQPDSITYYLNKPHKVKLFDYEKGTIEKEMSTMDSIRYMVHFMHCAMVAMEPQSGAVKAWVGDIDFNSWKYDKVTAMRQPGSTFKLFVYTEAMNQGLTPCDKRRDEYISMQVYDKNKHENVTWTPSNANGSFSGDSMPLKSAFAKSVNSIAVRLGQEMGIKRIITTAQAMGIHSPLDDQPSLALGASDVNLLEMVNAYCVIADNGKHHDPVLVTRIVDHEGNEVYVGPKTDEQVIPYKSAFFMQKLLMSGTHDAGGTSVSFSSADYAGSFFRDTDFGGKTGTSNNHSDAWFIAVSPKLVVGAWVGGEYRSIHFRTGALGQGSKTALPICGYFIKSVFSDPAFQGYHGKFDKPKDEDITSDMYGCESYYKPVVRDTVKEDSLTHEDEIQLDANGNPIPRNLMESVQGIKVEEQKGEKKRTHPTEQTVTLEDL
ncbi:MAG: transglycosylase domain-containing protein [Prevotella buccae]|uniref:transglycosylase domain-containing protein n=1 Tax=Segatella buccae TaxID=28126 RepID=UPI00242ED67D|nr:transglycosylase domain-containing protein [Segatella buccae]MBS5895270.1 transglycosylase domain-containing protein [Segatella buccae]